MQSLFKSFSTQEKNSELKIQEELSQNQNEENLQNVKFETHQDKKQKQQKPQQNPQNHQDDDLAIDLFLEINKIYKLKQFRKFSTQSLIQQNYEESVQNSQQRGKCSQITLQSQNLQVSGQSLDYCKKCLVHKVKERICMCKQEMKQNCRDMISMQNVFLSVSQRTRSRVNQQEHNQRGQRAKEQGGTAGIRLIPQIPANNKPFMTNNCQQQSNNFLIRKTKIIMLIITICFVTLLYIPILLLYIIMALGHSCVLSIMNVIQCKKNEPSFFTNLIKYYKFQKQRIIQLYQQLHKCFYPNTQTNQQR